MDTHVRISKSERPDIDLHTQHAPRTHTKAINNFWISLYIDVWIPIEVPARTRTPTPMLLQVSPS